MSRGEVRARRVSVTKNLEKSLSPRSACLLKTRRSGAKRKFLTTPFPQKSPIEKAKTYLLRSQAARGKDSYCSIKKPGMARGRPKVWENRAFSSGLSSGPFNERVERGERDSSLERNEEAPKTRKRH